MRSSVFLLPFVATLICAAASSSPNASVAGEPPAWAYPVPSPDFKSEADNGRIRRVPDSKAGYTLTQLRDRFLAPDWHPADHPRMPAIVAHGRKPYVYACGFCHRADGPGGPENASLAGLPYAYIVRQMSDYKSGKRSTALPERLPQASMIALAKALADDEVQAAAKYFSSLKPRKNAHVVETDRVPKTYAANWVLAVREGAEKEALEHRILETPENLERFESRDTHATFIAYVPPGSLREGSAIVHGQRASIAPPCVTCHGEHLRGQGAVPSIAGRSPSYIVRQLYDFQTGVRNGRGALLMKPSVARLSADDMISIAAYLASLQP